MISTLGVRPALVGLAVMVAGVFVSARVLAAEEKIVQSVAGGGNLSGYAPNEAAISLANTSGLALHPVAGELYFSDTDHHQVYKVDTTTGLIELVAGNGTESFSGDGGVAVSAGLDRPGALAFNAEGTVLFIADNGNLRVRRVDMLTGIIATFAGNGLVEGVAPAGDGGPATSAAFGGNIGGIAVRANGDVLLSDTSNHYVRRVAGGTIAAFAGILNSAGTSGDGAAATAATLRNPRGLVFDGTGNLYIATQSGGSADDRVRKVNVGGTISTFSGADAAIVPDPFGDGGNADVALLDDPATLAYDPVSQFLYVGSIANGTIRVIRVGDAPPTITTISGAGGTNDLGPAGGDGVSASGMVVDAAGNLYMADFGDSSIRRVDAATGFIDTVVGRISVFGQIGDRSRSFTQILEDPAGMDFDAGGNLYIADPGADVVRRIGADGTVETVAGTGVAGYSGDGGPAFQATLDRPLDVEVVGSNLYIADFNNTAIRVVDLATGLIRTFAQTNSGDPLSIAADSTGNLFVATDGDIVERVATNGAVTDFAGQNGGGGGAADSYTGPVDAATFSNLSGIVVAANGDVFVTEGNGGDRVRRLSANGLTTTRIAGSSAAGSGFSGDGGDALLAQFDRPVGIAITANGSLLVADSRNHRLRLIDTTVVPNIITTVAGDGTEGITGDGGPAALARVNDPQEVISFGGAIFFADTGNNRIRTMTDAIVIDPKKLSVAAKLNFSLDKRTGLRVRGRDSLAVKAGLPLPAGIVPAGLVVRVDVIELRDQVQLDAKGKQPKPVPSPAATGPAPVFDFEGFRNTTLLGAKLKLGLKATSTGTEPKPIPFAYAAKGTFSDDLGRAGFVNETTATTGIPLPVRVNITLGTVTFTGVTTVTWKATQAKGGAAKSVKVK